MEKKDNNYTIPEIPKLEVTKYRKAGVDEYRRLHWKKNGINKSTVKDYKFGDFISAEDLFKKSNFAKEQMPAIYEDEYGNVWERLVEEGK